MNNKFKNVDCVFCKIVKDIFPSYKYLEDKNFICILDINPNCKGASLVISKKHFPSDIFTNDEKILKEAITFSKKAAAVLKKKLKPDKIGLIVDGSGVPHLHLKLMPMYKGKNTISEAIKREYNKYYPGYISSLLGPRAEENTLKKLFKVLRD